MPTPQVERTVIALEVFPDLRQADFGEFTKHKIVIQRTARHRDASIEALGIGSTATGGRADLIIADDVVDRRNALSSYVDPCRARSHWRIVADRRSSRRF